MGARYVCGLIGGEPAVFPESLRQRCAVHAFHNFLKKVSKPDQEQVKKDYWAIQ